MTTTPKLTRRGLLGFGVAVPVLAGMPSGLVNLALADDKATSGYSPHGAGYYRFSIGDLKATVISDGYGNVPFWPIFAANQPASVAEPFLKENHLNPAPQFTNNLLVVDTPTDRVLVDTGFGDVLGPGSGRFPYLVPNLARAGIAPESITVVIISHIHLDHVAGVVTKSGSHVFPNARYVFVDDELSYWTGNRFEADINASKAPDEFKKAAIYAPKTYLPPLRQRMQVVRPGAEVVPGITLIPAPGHSPAHTAIRFSSGNAQFIHMADVAHRSDSGLQHPDWSVIFDFDGDQAIATRKRILGEVAADRTLVMGYHFPFPGLGYVEAAGSAYRWNAIPWSWS
ncbi:putative Lactamase [Mesorhizobium prunaredense]|uniref:Putative Lactamase n=1 Tax=Mesorhizobium prunaredense TaxID=1631249 RepID=A0A1R3V4N4_9HYPH|nr:MBL fold metallo-hydrolase [Mesorhizobium prunaredense]SIT54873.1 putative Lactamase [Mesorhizobium prunaredense]